MDEEHIDRAKLAFANYQDDCVNRLSYQQMALSQASLKQKTVLLKSGFGEYLTSLLNCIEANQNVLSEILDSANMQFQNPLDATLNSDATEEEEEEGYEQNVKKRGGGGGVSNNPAKFPKRTLRLDHQRVNSTLLAIAREWSVDGANERSDIYGPILEELQQRLSPSPKANLQEEPDTDEEGEVTVLVLGSGLARLPFEIAARFAGRVKVLANESSVSALFAANFVLNRCERVDNFRIYPYVSDLTDRVTSRAVTCPVAFPDIDVIKERAGKFKFQMLPGDFEALCNTSVLPEESADCVVTCFYLDSVKNILTCVEKIWQVLRSGGIWINLGDLECRYKRNFEETRDEDSTCTTAPLVNLPWTTLKQVLTKDFKFELLKEEILEPSYFGFQGSSMRQNVIKCPFFVCQKQ